MEHWLCLSVIDFSPCDKVLDLGCGYGIVGILAAKLHHRKKSKIDKEPTIHI